MNSEKLSYATQLIKSGNKQAALPILREIVQADPNDENAWLWLYSCVDKSEQKKYCLQQVLKINPYNQHAHQALEKLNGQVSNPLPTASPTTPKQTINKTVRINPKSKEKKGSSLWYKIGLFSFVGGSGLGILAAALNLPSDSPLFMFAGLLAGTWVIHYWISGYVGAYKLVRKGHASQFITCSIFLGGLPLLLPMFLGWFLLAYANKLPDKNKPDVAYVQCSSCKAAVPENVMYCPRCGSQLGSI